MPEKHTFARGTPRAGARDRERRTLTPAPAGAVNVIDDGPTILQSTQSSRSSGCRGFGIGQGAEVHLIGRGVAQGLVLSARRSILHTPVLQYSPHLAA